MDEQAINSVHGHVDDEDDRRASKASGLSAGSLGALDMLHTDSYTFHSSREEQRASVPTNPNPISIHVLAAEEVEHADPTELVDPMNTPGTQETPTIRINEYDS